MINICISVCFITEPAVCLQSAFIHNDYLRNGGRDYNKCTEQPFAKPMRRVTVHLLGMNLNKYDVMYYKIWVVQNEFVLVFPGAVTLFSC